MTKAEQMDTWDLSMMIESGLDYASWIRDTIQEYPDAWSVTLARVVDGDNEFVAPVLTLVHGELDADTLMPITTPVAILFDQQNPAFDILPLTGVAMNTATGERKEFSHSGMEALQASYEGKEADVLSNGPHGQGCECEWPIAGENDGEES